MQPPSQKDQMLSQNTFNNQDGLKVEEDDEEYEDDEDQDNAPTKGLTRVDANDMKNAVKEMNSNEETSNGDGYSDDNDQGDSDGIQGIEDLERHHSAKDLKDDMPGESQDQDQQEKKDDGQLQDQKQDDQDQQQNQAIQGADLKQDDDDEEYQDDN